MVKKIRFDLKLFEKNVGTLEELRENFELESILRYYNDGKLEKWLKSRNYSEEAQKVATIAATDNIEESLCEIFSVAFTQEELNKIVNGDDKQVIYLYGDKFNIDAKEKNKTYIFMNQCDSQLTIKCSSIDYLCDIDNELKQRSIEFNGASSVIYEYGNGCKVFPFQCSDMDIENKTKQQNVEIKGNDSINYEYSNGCKIFSL